MTACYTSNADTGRFFSRLAGLYRLHFRLFGFENTQRQLIEGTRRAGFRGAELLEVGCGAGHLHQRLLEDGAARALGVDLSQTLLAVAQAQAKAQGLEQRTAYRLGDFVQIADEIPEADITILDKVVCCYPDWQALVDATLTKTRRVYALTYPRDRSTTRAGVWLMRRGLRLLGCCYQPYLHDPERIQTRILDHGFRRTFKALTASWMTEVYSREAVRSMGSDSIESYPSSRACAKIGQWPPQEEQAHGPSTPIYPSRTAATRHPPGK
ncbi:MAG: class I SAM-dependent methyltransferase [Gammaproteobacteria bacterium]